MHYAYISAALPWQTDKGNAVNHAGLAVSLWRSGFGPLEVGGRYNGVNELAYKVAVDPRGELTPPLAELLAIAIEYGQETVLLTLSDPVRGPAAAILYGSDGATLSEGTTALHHENTHVDLPDDWTYESGVRWSAILGDGNE